MRTIFLLVGSLPHRAKSKKKVRLKIASKILKSSSWKKITYKNLFVGHFHDIFHILSYKLAFF